MRETHVAYVYSLGKRKLEYVKASADCYTRLARVYRRSEWNFEAVILSIRAY